VSRPPSTAGKRRALELALFAAMAAGLFFRLGSDRLYPTSERRCFAVVAEMVRSGDWLVPKLDGEPRLQKPPLFYWAAATVAELAGGDSRWTLRSVSAAAALALAAAVFAVGRSLGGWPAGFCSAAVLAAMALFWVRGRIGDAEMLLTLLVFLGLAAFERLWSAGDRRMAPTLALLVGLGFLTKATAALLSVGAPILAWLALQRSLRLAVRPRALAWAAAAAALGLSWYLLILLRVPEAGAEFRAFLISPFGVHALHRDATHVRSLLYYLPRVPLQTLPAGLLFLPLGWEAWRERLWRADPRLHFYAVAFVAQLVAWSLVPGKQIHYVLGLLPLFAVIAGRRISAHLV
jgi:4-amino-4-deoxy-L-arabinose transferase-like glycosyltransferase